MKGRMFDHQIRVFGCLVVPFLVPGFTASGCAASDEPARPAATEPETERFRGTVERSALRERAIAILLELSVSSEPQLRANALEAMLPATARLRGPVAAGLADENEGVRTVAAIVAGRAGLKDLEAALTGLVSDHSPYVQAGAIYALRTLGHDTDPTPLGVLLLEHPDTRVRAHAAFLLGELGDASALPMLRQALHTKALSATPEEERVLGLQIAEAMVKLGDNTRIEGIRAALYPAHPDEFEVAVLAIQILGRLGDRGSIGQLINLSNYKQGNRKMPGEVRLAVADAVARMGRREGWFIAEEFLKDPDPFRRALAAHVLGQTRRDEDLATLERLMGDPSAVVRSAAAGGVLEAVSSSGSRRSASSPTD